MLCSVVFEIMEPCIEIVWMQRVKLHTRSTSLFLKAAAHQLSHVNGDASSSGGSDGDGEAAAAAIYQGQSPFAGSVSDVANSDASNTVVLLTR